VAPPLGAVWVELHLRLEEEGRLVEVPRLIGLFPRRQYGRTVSPSTCVRAVGGAGGRREGEAGSSATEGWCDLYSLLQSVLEPNVRVCDRCLEPVLGSWWGLGMVA